MSNADAVALLLGIIVPFVVGLLAKASWPAAAKFVIALVVSGIAGAAALWSQDMLSDLSWETAVQTLALVVLAGQATYALFVRSIPGLNDWLYCHGIKDDTCE